MSAQLLLEIVRFDEERSLGSIHLPTCVIGRRPRPDDTRRPTPGPWPSGSRGRNCSSWPVAATWSCWNADTRWTTCWLDRLRRSIPPHTSARDHPNRRCAGRPLDRPGGPDRLHGGDPARRDDRVRRGPGRSARDARVGPARAGPDVDRVSAVVLTGGSAFGLAACDGVMRWCEERGIGYPTPPGRCRSWWGWSSTTSASGIRRCGPAPAEGYAACEAARSGGRRRRVRSGGRRHRRHHRKVEGPGRCPPRGSRLRRSPSGRPGGRRPPGGQRRRGARGRLNQPCRSRGSAVAACGTEAWRALRPICKPRPSAS